MASASSRRGGCRTGRSAGALLAGAAAVALLAGLATAAGPLPEGSRIDPPRDRVAALRMASELAGGRQSALVALGGAAFVSPLLYGEAARAAGISCNACHANGHVNQSFHIPGHSARPGSFDATSALFNPRADNGLHDPVDIPSLRGIRHLGPYGRDGRFGSLREFARHVIVDEFAGPEPAPLILDALAAWLSELEFLPNPRLAAFGRLGEGASAAEQQGEALFHRPLPGLGGQACATCHIPSAGFTDGRSHDVGTGGRFRTPTLLNAATSAPYFHDGRAADLGEVVAHFDSRFRLGLSAAERDALRAYLEAVGDAEDAWEPPAFRREMAELAVWVELLRGTLRDGEATLTRLVADTLRHELGRIARNWPLGETSTRPDRQRARFDPAALSALLEEVAVAGEAGDTARGLDALERYYALAETMVANYPREAGAAPR